MKRCMQYFYIGLMLSFQLTAQASIRNIEDTPVNFDGIKNFKIMNDFGYITLGSDGLKFFSLSTPNETEECSNKVVRCQLLGRSVEHIEVVGNYIYLTTDYGLEIIEQISSSRAERVGALSISSARKVVIKNDLAYVIVGDDQVNIINIANRESPKLISSYKSGNGGFDKIVISGNYMYLTAAGVRYFFIVDVSNPASPKETIRYVTKETVSNLAVIGDYLYVIGSSASIFDVKTDPSNPKEIKLANPLYFSPLSNIIIQGKYAYFIGSDSLTIVDITNPKNPISKESYSFPNNTVYKVSVSDDYIYLADKTGLKKLKFEPVAVVCSYTVNTTPITLEDWDANSEDSSISGNLLITTTNPYCEWTAQSNSDWLTILPSEGVGNATIYYVVKPNVSPEIRYAQITIADKTINVTQKRWGAFIFFNEESKIYKFGQTIDPVILNVIHSYNMLDITDFWLAVSHIPEKKSSEEASWYYKQTPKSSLDFIPFSLNNLDTMKPLIVDVNADRLKEGYTNYKWSVVPLLQGVLPKGEYTFYAIATVREINTTETAYKEPYFHYNPVPLVLNNDTSKLFSNLAVFKLIIQ